jgi:hypothetical protein
MHRLLQEHVTDVDEHLRGSREAGASGAAQSVAVNCPIATSAGALDARLSLSADCGADFKTLQQCVFFMQQQAAIGSDALVRASLV